LLIEHRVMTKPGLALLAETYGLRSEELNQLKLVAKRLLDEIREEIPRMAGRPLRTAGLGLRVGNFSSFSAGHRPRYFAAVRDENGLVAVMRTDPALARALVGAAMGRRPPGAQGGEGEPMSLLESEVLSAISSAVLLRGVNRAIVPMLGVKQAMRIARFNDTADLGAEIPAGGQQVVIATAECEFEDVRGSLAFALAPRVVARLRARVALQAEDAGGRRTAGAQRVRIGGVRGAELALHAVLGATVMWLGEMRRVAPGSIIFLRKMDRPSPRVELRCSDTPLFSGTVVRDRGWYRFVVEQKVWKYAKPA
jgi:flagellar motor switch protein FliM